MKLKVLHVIGGSFDNGAFKGANILHKSLIKNNINSKILSDAQFSSHVKKNTNNNKIIFVNQKFFDKILNKLFIHLEKFIKFIFLHSPRDTFNICFFGFNITKFKEYKDADIIHIHWLREGFINIKSLSKIDKPVVWTMRDMWPFNGGPHYTMDFMKYEKTYFSKILKNYKMRNYNKNYNFIAVSDWLKKKAQKSYVLKKFNINQIDNNIDISELSLIKKKKARFDLDINTKKQIICYGAQNPQSKRKGWHIFTNALKLLDKSNFFLLIFGNFWSHKTLEDIGIEYKSLGYIDDKTTLSKIYSSADLFVASSIQDAWPKTFAEAMFFKNPVVCLNNTSISEIVDHKVNGFITKNHNPRELKIGIEWVSSQIKKNNSLGKNAKKKILNYDVELISRKYISLYKKILKRKFKN
jgi:glycosyltransferase involved in cell wall biosynthesis